MKAQYLYGSVNCKTFPELKLLDAENIGPVLGQTDGPFPLALPMFIRREGPKSKDNLWENPKWDLHITYFP